MKLYKEIQGQGPLLVLLHGWGFSHLVWQDIVPILAQRYTVMNIDLPGFGESPLLGVHSLASMSEAVLTEIPEKATLLAWSLGGLIGQYLTIHHAEHIERLICVTSSPCFVKRPNWPGIQEFLLKNFAGELIHHYQKVLHRFLHLQFFGLDVDRNLLKKLEAQVILQKPSTHALQLGLELLLHTDLRADLARIQAPLNFIFGKLDVIVPASLGAVLPALNPQIQINIIEKAGHAPFISHPQAFLTATGLLQ